MKNQTKLKHGGLLDAIDRHSSFVVIAGWGCLLAGVSINLSADSSFYATTLPGLGFLTVAGVLFALYWVKMYVLSPDIESRSLGILVLTVILLAPIVAVRQMLRNWRSD